MIATFHAAPARAGEAQCPSVWPPRAPVSATSELDAEHLLLLRDIGMPEAAQSAPSPLAISPDGKRVAFFVTQASLAANDYCDTLVVLDLSTKSAPRALDSGGHRILAEEALRGVRRESGVPDINRPAWSPDGRSLAYRKRGGGRTQVWRVDIAGGSARQVTSSPQDVEGVQWSADGATLLYAVRPGRSDLEAERNAEAAQGYLYDARVLPHVGAEPQLPEVLSQAIMTVPASGGLAAEATAAQVSEFSPLAPLGASDLGPVGDSRGWRAGADAVDNSYFAARRLWAETPAGRRIVCAMEACTGKLAAVIWSGGQVLFLRREGWARETSAFYAWSPDTGTMRLLKRTADRLTGCIGVRVGVLCLSEASRQPRRLVTIDVRRGGERVLFDPNPELAGLVLPKVERLRWRNSLGLEAWGDLVLPKGKPPASGWPLVVVQYRSSGFLRGGVGDEYPIFPLAARGIAVLSFERPDFDTRANGVDGLVAAVYKDWADRRSVHESLMTGLDLVLARGDIDGRRLGLSGLSDGAMTTRYALIHAPDRFLAAAISTCGLEPYSVMVDGGIAQADWFRSFGFPPSSQPDAGFWKPMSLTLNAATIRTPLLMQISDDEYHQALGAFTALREHGKPVEMYVFPGEHHTKWQPVHRAAIYSRNLDWFAFWLQGRVDPDPVKAAQYRRWSALKTSGGTPIASGP
ncbi:Atxe2 family lasso peptide isopeptidase [Novosphingobium sp. Gsoil 351]|uniref:Atxe2 family lasso peptide isopeptidase n=1 Tax=Novosphingobium sp. Gsoil 351 TaxID=2675225 RepID=UPI0012B4C960|nr:Atxe2 family lasso peptide isopeptidase [Novosphingobium sp. Gsoil 351]QGN54098.1 Atxe2 family lasso peptide isopeptidase [Novosphingobium sp. Gsoil 351]